jgi:two-component system chemotaxis response regulator CheY
MKTLIVDDDFTSRLLLQGILKTFGPAHLAANGKEAVEAVRIALTAGEPYDLVCLDILMPEMDGQHCLREIRALEAAKGVISSSCSKIVMITALADSETILEAIRGRCDRFLAKPIDKAMVLRLLRTMAMIA